MNKTAKSLLLGAILMTVAVACGPSAGDGGTTPQANGGGGAATADTGGEDGGATRDVVTLTGFMMNGGNQANIDRATWYTNFLRDELGIVLEFIDTAGTPSTQMMQTLLASGDLPDLIGFGGGQGPGFANTAAQAGMLLNLEDHAQYLPSIFANRQYYHALNYSRDHLSGGRGNVYVVATIVGAENNINFDQQLRWDVYREIGMPPVRVFEDFLDVVEMMLEAYPVNYDGQGMFGFSIFGEWDGDGMLYAWEAPLMWGRRNINGYLEVDVTGNDPHDIISTFDDNSGYLRMLRFFFEANQRGILDPDSITQDWPSVQAKKTDGRVMWSYWPWASAGFNIEDRVNADPPIGYASVWSECFVNSVSADAWTGRLESMGISANASNIEAALRMWDFYFSFDGMSFMHNGPQGELWDYDASGLRYRTPRGFQAFIHNPSETFMEGGGLRADAQGIFGPPPMTWETIHPGTNGQTISSNFWDDVLYYNPSNLLLDWRAHNDNAFSKVRWAIDNNRTAKITQAVDMMATVPDDILSIISTIRPIVVTNSWRMIYAADEAEFYALWEEIRNSAEGLGLATAQEWGRQNWIDTVNLARNYMP